MGSDFSKTSLKKLKYLKEYRKKNKEKIRERTKRWRERNKDRIDKRITKRRRFIREETIKFLGNKCKKCGFSDWRTLQVDHVNGGGGKEKRELGGSRTGLLKRIKETPEKYQLLCANCNWIKKYENHELNQYWRKEHLDAIT